MKDVFESIGKRVPTFCGMKTDLLRGLLARQANDSFSIFLAGDLVINSYSEFKKLRMIV